MPEEIGVASWKESKVREVIKDFYIIKPSTQLRAKFIVKKLSDIVPVHATFIDQSEGNPVSWEWNFDENGSNIISNEQYPYFIYNTPGKYTVSLHIFDSDGNSDYVTEFIETFGKQGLDPNDKSKIIKKIEEYNGDIKKLLIRIIEENEELINIVEKYFRA